MATEKKTRGREAFQRFTLSQRIEHIILVVAFTGLALTGLPQKFALQPWAETMIAFMGGIERVRIIHRVMAAVLMLETIYHGGVVTYKLYVLRQPPYMLPSFQDVRDMIYIIAYNLGLRDERPKMGRFNFEEKMEYWAVVWGLAIMGVTGFMMWNPITTTHLLPGQVVPAAKSAHGNEALLAVLAIIIWHMYNEHISHFNTSIFTGKIDRETMEKKHALELEVIESGRVPPPPPPEVYRKRMRVFVPFAVVMTILLLAGVVWFITFEQTAIATIPPPP